MVSEKELNSIEGLSWDDQDKLVYKGVSLHIPKWELMNNMWTLAEIKTMIESGYKAALPYHRERAINKLGI